MATYQVQYIEEREEDDDWEIDWELEDKEAALKHAKELSEGTNIDAVRVMKVEPIFEYYDEDAFSRPWSKKRNK